MDPLVALAGAALTALCAAITALYRQSVVEGKRKDQLIDRLLNQADRTAEVADRTVSLVEKGGTRR